MLLNMARGREYRFGNLIYMFKKGSDGVLSAALIMALIDTVLMIPFYYMVNMTAPAAETMEAVLEWSQPIMYSALAATVLGVVIKLPFAMAFYILADNPQMKGREALKKKRVSDEGTYDAVSCAADQLYSSDVSFHTVSVCGLIMGNAIYIRHKYYILYGCDRRAERNS